MIHISENNGQFDLSNDKISWIFEIREGQPVHLYFGKKLNNYVPLPDQAAYKRNFCTAHPGFADSFDTVDFEMPQPGRGDYRIPGLELREEDRDCFDFRYAGYEVLDTLLQPAGMPGIEGPGKTLKLILKDEASSLELWMLYGLCEDYPGIFRFQRLFNQGQNTVEVEQLASGVLHLAPSDCFLLSLAGTHLKEGTQNRMDLKDLCGILELDSRRGCSSAQHPPFAALCAQNTDWNHGDIFSVSLLYSGNHATVLEKDFYGKIRLTTGLHPDTLHWHLQPEASFDTPQAVFGWTQEGFNGMAQSFHHLFLERLFRRGESDILINSWESFYYDTTQENLKSLAEEAARLGMELCVVDDGWFRKENNSLSAIGDWKVQSHKLPQGLEGVSRDFESQGLKMGLWFEPEAVSASSELARLHPDWILCSPHREPVEGRHELLLNLSKKEVQDHLIRLLDEFLSTGAISYVKWDMNRPMTDVSRSMVSHAYILGLYRVLETITQKYPDVIIEGCASGGSRLDPGMLHYVHQNWASDNTDSWDRKSIQSGLALFLPAQKLGAHVAACPSHQTGRNTALQDRFETARFFCPGYELRLSALTEEEKKEVKREVEQLKEERSWMRHADFFQEEDLWAKVDASRERAEVLVFREHFDPADAFRRIRISWLKPESVYRIEPLGIELSGEQLRQAGFCLPLVQRDFAVVPLHLKAV